MSRTGPPSISTHVLDTERGIPAAGVAVTLSRLTADGFQEISTQRTDEDGRIETLLPTTLEPGAYQLAFGVAGYFRGQGRETSFLERVVIEFRVRDTSRHYHVPLLLSPYACTSYRGS